MPVGTDQLHGGPPEPARDEAIAAASHAIRGPLTAVVGYSARLRSALSSGRLVVDEQQAEAILLLAREARRLQDRVLGMLDLELLERGALTVEVEPLRLNRLVEREVALLRDDDSRLDITVQASDELVVESDQVHVSRIVRTLLENAATHAGTQPIQVLLQPSDPDGATITVRDRGAGIPAALQRDLLQRRYVLDGETRFRSGLGLHLAARLAVRLGGALALDPREEGASFTLALPPAPPEPS